jgi:hypothetical protein
MSSYVDIKLGLATKNENTNRASLRTKCQRRISKSKKHKVTKIWGKIYKKDLHDLLYSLIIIIVEKYCRSHKDEIFLNIFVR